MSTGDTQGANDNQITVTLISGQSLTGNNFLDTQPVTIGDYAWLDGNGNGLQDTNEIGYSNVVVVLYVTNASAGTLTAVATNVTPASGAYTFTGFLPNTYVVGFSLPTGFNYTTPGAGSDAALDSDVFTNGLTAVLTPTSGQVNPNLDAGFYRPVTLACPSSATVSCTSQVPAPDTNSVTAGGGCGGALTVTHVGDAMSSSNCPNQFILTRTYQVADGCGNTTTCSQTITVSDTTTPTFTFCPANQTNECASAALDFGTPLASDTCGTVTITVLSTVTNLTCGNTFVATRTWSAADQCGNSNSCSQIIATRDTTAPAVTTAQGANATIECPAAPSFSAPVFTDACQGVIAPSVMTMTNTVGCTNIITRTWTATDGCGNSTNRSQVITVIDTTAPVITCAANKNADLGTAWSFDPPTAVDGCAGTNVTITVLSTETNSPSLCAEGYSVTRTWQAADPCGNTATCSQTVCVRVATVTGHVYFDTNGNGVQDAGEPNLTNVTVSVTDSTNGTQVVTTDSSGNWSVIVPPGATTDTINTTNAAFISQAGVNPLQTQGSNPTTTTAVAGATRSATPDGFFQPATLLGSVKLDVNGNGAADVNDTTGISPVVLTVYRDGTNLLATLTNSADGSFALTNLPPGSYTVVQTVPAGYAATTPVSVVVTLTSGSTGRADFLDAMATSVVGDWVWRDLNINGLQDAGDPGVSNVTVHIYSASGTLLATTVSGTTGWYAFSNLVTGSYIVEVEPPKGYGITTPRVGGNPLVDSDADPVTGRTPLITLSGGEVNLSVDFGLIGILNFAQLRKVTGQSEGEQCVLRWETTAESGTAGWIVQRQAADGAWLDVSGFMPAVGHTGLGGEYSWVDADVTPESKHTYRLVEIENRGGSRAGRAFEIEYTPGAEPASASQETHEASRTYPTYTWNEKPAPVSAQPATTRASRGPAARGGVVTAVKVHVKTPGLYRVSAVELATAFGVSTNDIANLSLAVRNVGRAVSAVRVGGDVLFYGRSYESRYTDQNVYWVLPGALDAPESLAVPAASGTPALSFATTNVVEQQLSLRPDLFDAPESDPWLWSQLISGFKGTFTSPVFSLPALAGGTGGELVVQLKGASAAAGQSQHQVRLLVNGVQRGTAAFEGLDPVRVPLPIPAGGWNETGNRVQVVMDPPAGTSSDLVYVDRFEVRYQRQFTAVNGALVFDAVAGNVRVTGLPTAQLELWDVTDGWTARRLHGGAITPEAAGYAVEFVAPQAGRYVVASQGAELTPARLSPSYGSDLKRVEQAVDHLIVAGAGLEAGAAALAAYRSSHGLNSVAVSLEEVYDTFNYGLADARALKALLSYAHRQWVRGPRYVLLAGAGSLDFRNEKGYGDSLIPGLVAATPEGLYASDGGLADVDGDGLPDLAVGRLPIKAAAEFTSYLRKVQSYEAGGAWKQTVGVATDDRDQGGTYIADGNTVAARIGNRTVVRADVETLGASAARAALLQCLNSGAELSMYMGHGSFNQVAEEGLLTVADAQGMTNNTDRAGVVSLFGCLMGSFATPGATSVGAALVNGAGGASAVLAAGTLVTHADSRLLADGLVAALYHQGLTRLGDAVVAGQSSPVLAPYEILGDPGLAMGAANAPRGGSGAAPGRGSYAEWAEWAFAPIWSDLGLDREAEADADQDGASNYAEYVAGTDPVDAGSRLTLSISRVRVLGGGRVELTWPAVPGRTYRVERSVSLAGGFVPVATGLAATAPWNTWTDDPQAAGAMNCYRIVVE